ncbi:MAG: hypothetical protein KDK55_00020 [Chlamydiia bacterium]|nr:hypothetical protein [Chlamydiia bacterium]
MKNLFIRLFIINWSRKLVALIAAVIIWFLVYESMTTTRTIPHVPVRVTNLAADQTIDGLLPNGLLKKRIPVTITGRKSIVDELRSSDIEIVINAEGREESWVAAIEKKNLISLIPNINFAKYLTDISASDIYIHVSSLMTEEIPVTVRKPIGEPPKGYQYLDVWPKTLMQTVSGPKEEIEKLKKQGIDLTFNLSRITKEELDRIGETQAKNGSDEVSYFVPNTWKEVAISFKDGATEPLNDPRAKFLRIDFLRSELIPLSTDLQVAIFYPLQHSKILNPDTITLAITDPLKKKNGIPILDIPLFAKDVSHLFLNVVKNNLQLMVLAAPPQHRKSLNWTVEVIDQELLEEIFITKSLQEGGEKPDDFMQLKLREEYLRHRFRTYVLQMRLFTSDEKKLRLHPHIEGQTIKLS